MTKKEFKDPVYGYIRIDNEIVQNVIDTATFQRLRNIRQTSYAPLYPGALHNRFIHSLGVCHLGQIAFNSLQNSYKYYKNEGKTAFSDLKDDWTRYRFVFELACLLHDVGHAPFSHTGEDFYKNSRSSTIIENKGECVQVKKNATSDDKHLYEAVEENQYDYLRHLSQLTNDSVYLTSAAENPAPHEIMSCIVALEKFNDLFLDDLERSFFARCITGLQFESANIKNDLDYIDMPKDEYVETKEKALLNCFIQLLHSSVIDVDRLDYIIRDSVTIGYQSVSVDYERLLNGFALVPLGDNIFTLGFRKNAISVIENAVYAHDNERKWVQSHPTILYDSFLLQQSINYIEDKMRKEYADSKSTLFSYDSLTDGGSQFGTMRIRFLGDADLIYLMKNTYACSESEEYFHRNTRRLPLWKSESEFMDFMNDEDRKYIISVMQSIGLQQDSLVIDDELLDKRKNSLLSAPNTASKISFQRQVKYINAILGVCEQYGVKRSLALVSTSFFKSNFSKADVKRIKIVFPGGKPRELQDVSSILSSKSPHDDKAEKKFCYFYYYPKENRQKVDRRLFTVDLIKALKK